MGLGLYITGKPMKKGLLPLRRNPAKLPGEIRAAIEAAITDPLQRRLTTFHEQYSGLQVKLHPGEEDLSFSIRDGAVVADAKTSSVGPGYHAMLVELIEAVGVHAAIDWSWEDHGNGEGDETGYHQHRDFGKLRESMAKLLVGLSKHVTADKSANIKHVRLCLPIGDNVVGDDILGDDRALTPLGPFSRDWFTALAEGDEAQIERSAPEFYAAWHGPNHARYWANCGLYLMLWGLGWTAPEGENERGLYETVLSCFDRARLIDPAIEIPEIELAEIRKLINSSATDTSPRPNGLGYRRGMMNRQLIDPWSADIPGYFRSAVEDDGKTMVYWFGAREVHASSRVFKWESGTRTAKDVVMENATPKDGSIAFGFTPARDYLAGGATVQPVDTGPYFAITALLGCGNEVCHLTVVHEDSAEGVAWAREVLESTSRPLPRDDD